MSDHTRGWILAVMVWVIGIGAAVSSVHARRIAPYEASAMETARPTPPAPEAEKTGTSSQHARAPDPSSRTPRESPEESATLTSGVRETSWIIGATYPGITLGYQTDRFVFEARGFMSSDITLYGGRVSHFVYPFQGGNVYWGTDLLWVGKFEGQLTEGNGYMPGAFLGIQKYMGDHVSFTVDSGPYFIKLEDDISGGAVTVDGFEFVVNMGLNVHF